MALQALVGALRATLSLDTAAFEDGSKRAVSEADKLAKNISRTLKGLGLGVIAERFVSSLKSVIDEADKLQETAQKIGIPVEELSKLSFAADLSGASMETLTTAVGRLGRTIVTALKQPTGAAAEAFASLGLNVQQLAAANPSEALEMVSEAFQRIPDGARQSALGFQLFGRQFQEVLPLLNQGAQAIRESGKELQEFGAVISTRFAAQSDQFNDNIRRIQAFMDGLRIQLLEELLPALVKVSNDIVRFLKSFDLGSFSGSAFTKFVRDTIGDLYRLASAAKQVMIFFTGLSDVIDNIGTGRQLEIWEKTIALINAESEQLNANLAILNNSINNRGGIAGGGGIGGTTGVGGGAEPPLIDIPKRAKPFWDNLSNSIKLTDKELGKLKPIGEEVANIFQGIGASLGDAFADAALGTQSLKDSFRALAEDILRQATRLFTDRAFQALLSFLGSAFTPSFAPGVGPGGMGFTHFGGPRQHGGRVRRGKSFMVGEAGPEMFVPRTSGSIVPNSALQNNVQVKIIDQRTTAAAPIQQRTGADGSLEFVIRDTVRKLLPTELNRTLPGQFGARPRLSQRGS